MGIFDKMMATTLGIGGTKIDTIVNTKNIMPGKRIEGICKIKGGKVEQYIKEYLLQSTNQKYGYQHIWIYKGQ